MDATDTTTSKIIRILPKSKKNNIEKELKTSSISIVEPPPKI